MLFVLHCNQNKDSTCCTKAVATIINNVQRRREGKHKSNSFIAMIVHRMLQRRFCTLMYEHHSTTQPARCTAGQPAVMSRQAILGQMQAILTVSACTVKPTIVIPNHHQTPLLQNLMELNPLLLKRQRMLCRSATQLQALCPQSASLLRKHQVQWSQLLKDHCQSSVIGLELPACQAWMSTVL